MSDASVAAHYQDLARQSHAARLGMWIFIGSESLLFGGLFVLYAAYRSLFGASFALASHQLDRSIGTANTFVLLASSLVATLAVHFARQDRRRPAVSCLGLTIALGLLFSLLKGIEYAGDFRRGIVPAGYGHPAVPGEGLFYSLYFMLTGLHEAHLLIGIALLSWLALRTGMGSFGSNYDTPLELGAMYWHLVDIVWTFLFPLLYLVS